MPERNSFKVGIVDFGLGNLFSIMNACSCVGIDSVITSSGKELIKTDIVILPGVGAFGDAMSALKRRDLISPIYDIVASGKPLIGICLGLQLLFSDSDEFGHHEGLNVIQGQVVRFQNPKSPEGSLKVPQVCWNRIYYPQEAGTTAGELGEGFHRRDHMLMDGVENGSYMYFVHSYIIIPVEHEVILTNSTYGSIEFCSSIRKDAVYGFQFHPERSGNQGLRIYRNLLKLIQQA